MFIILTRNTNVFGAVKDWNHQHWVFPEYFRNLFYKNHDLLPDFAFNIGSGQNIYNFAYFGLLNPIILFSYLLPFISMRDYIIGSAIFMLLLGVIFMYFFIKKKSNSKVAFLTSFFFMMATPLIFHTHRHIMFVDYMPFLIMAYFGVDRFFEKNKKILLSISVFLMIMTSFYYSVSGIFSIIIYGIFVYLNKIDRFKFKSFVIDGIKFVIPILIGVLLSGVLIVPTMYGLLAGRSGDKSSIDLLSLFIPNLKINNFLYSSYSLGLSFIGFFSLIRSYFDNDKSYKFLSIILTVLLSFPLFAYILNGTLYTELKVFIPFIPLFMILISKTLSNINKHDFKYFRLSVFFISIVSIFDFQYFIPLVLDIFFLYICLYLVITNKKILYLLFEIPVIFIFACCFNFGEKYVKLDKHDDFANYLEKIDDDSFYRVNIINDNLDSVNRIYKSQYYQGYIYSSASNYNYKDFYYKIGNNIRHRSYGMLNDSENIFYNIYMGNKYIIKKDGLDSSFYKKINNGIYEYDNVLPIAYLNYDLMSKNDYSKLEFPDNSYALLKYTIVDEDVKSNYESVFEKIDLDYDVIYNSSNINSYKFNNKKESTIILKINNNIKDKVLIIDFDMNKQESCSLGDTSISINGIVNKLTCKDWKYQNKNNNFKYVISDNKNELIIKLSKGHFDIDNINVYTLDNKYLKDINSSIDELVIDKNKTKGDFIYGSINASRNGIVSTSITYDKGFNIYVDGDKIDALEVDSDFLGFKIDKGTHQIKIEYKSPYKNIGIIISIIGLILLGGYFMIFIIDFIGLCLQELKEPKTKLGKLYFKYKEIINYLIVGGLTTVVSLLSYYLFRVFISNYQICTVLSWICAVLFAYITNRIFVFESKNKNIIKEMSKFFSARILTLLFEMLFMFITVSLIHINDRIAKLVVQVFIVIFNYIISKFIVFTKNKEKN